MDVESSQDSKILSNNYNDSSSVFFYLPENFNGEFKTERLYYDFEDSHCLTDTKDIFFDVIPKTDSFAEDDSEETSILIPAKEKPFTCDVCGFRTKRSSHLKRHCRIHTNLQLFLCKICNYKTKIETNFNKHQQTHIGEKPFTCKFCECSNKSITLTKPFKKHVRKKASGLALDKKTNVEKKYNKEQPIKCEEFDFTENRKQYLKKDLTEPWNQSENSDLRPFPCGICDYKAKRLYHLQEHLKVHTRRKTFQCYTCNFKTIVKVHFKRHECNKKLRCFNTIIIEKQIPKIILTRIDTRLPDPWMCKTESDYLIKFESYSTDQKSKTLLSCEACIFKTSRELYFRNHLQCHKIKTVHTCKICGYKTPRLLHLNRHMSVHNKPQPLKCETCNYEGFHANNLKRHIKNIHSGIKKTNYSCTQCNYKSSRKYLLKHHEKLHSFTSPVFSCEYCNYLTVSKAIFERHLRQVHTLPAMKFRCVVCDFSSTYEYCIQRHVRLRHPNNDKALISCSQCNHKTNSFARLIRHQRIHTLQQPHPCERCDYVATSKKNWRRHLDRVHLKKAPVVFRQCDSCKYITKSSICFQKHLEKHKKLRTLKNEQFLCRFLGNYSKEGHCSKQKSFSIKQLFLCQKCDYKGKRKSDLMSHSLIHVEERPFACKTCSYKAKRKSHLMQHIKIHTKQILFFK